MKIIIWDYEVFKYDSLLGCIILDGISEQVYQTWDFQAQVRFYSLHQNDMWIGWNSNSYDDSILETVVQGKDPYVKSKDIIERHFRPWTKLQLYSYDLTNPFLKKPSLKVTEAWSGESIETTEVDFNLDRPLTDEEKRKTEFYNLADLRKTIDNFKKAHNQFELRCSIINEFGIPLQKGLRMTGTQIAAAALGAKANPMLQYLPVHPTLPPTLQVKNQKMIDWYLGEKFRDATSPEKNMVLHICGVDISIAAGGAHSQCDDYKSKKMIYIDVSGYYNLLMINYDLLPRTLDEAGKEKYAYMYHSQLKLKKTNPAKRAIYKTICLSVFGAMGNEGTEFYDPWKGPLVTTTGEMFIWDLLEKLDGLGVAANVNTDGLFFDPYDWNDEEKIKGIIQEWSERNNFQVKLGIITDYRCRDVNCYIMKDINGDVCVKGDVFKAYDTSDDAYAAGSYFNTKEPPIIAKGLVAALLDGIYPEDFVEQNKYDLRLFQYVAKKDSFKYLTYDVTLPDKVHTSTEIQSPSRAFANKANEIGTIKKHKTNKKGQHQTLTVPSLPPSVFIYNNEILSDAAIEAVSKRIDYGYYVNRIYEQLSIFL